MKSDAKIYRKHLLNGKQKQMKIKGVWKSDVTSFALSCCSKICFQMYASLPPKPDFKEKKLLLTSI